MSERCTAIVAIILGILVIMIGHVYDSMTVLALGGVIACTGITIFVMNSIFGEPIWRR